MWAYQGFHETHLFFFRIELDKCNKVRHYFTLYLVDINRCIVIDHLKQEWFIQLDLGHFYKTGSKTTLNADLDVLVNLRINWLEPKPVVFVDQQGAGQIESPHFLELVSRVLISHE